MELVSNWKDVFTKAWSVKFMGAAAAVAGLIDFIPYVADYLPNWLVIVLIAMAFGARFVAQEGLSKPAADDAD